MSFLEKGGQLTGRVEETTEKQKIAGKYLNSPTFLDWNTDFEDRDEVWAMERLEMFHNILNDEGINVKWLRFRIEKHKRLNVSKGRGGRKEMVQLFRPEIITAGSEAQSLMEERKKHTLKEKLMGPR